MCFFSKRLKNEFEIAVVNEPSVFKPPKFYCMLKCANCLNSHKFDIVHFPLMLTNGTEHFNSPAQTSYDFSFMPIEKVSNNWKRLLKVTSCMQILGTSPPKTMR